MCRGGSRRWAAPEFPAPWDPWAALTPRIPAGQGLCLGPVLLFLAASLREVQDDRVARRGNHSMAGDRRYTGPRTQHRDHSVGLPHMPLATCAHHTHPRTSPSCLVGGSFCLAGTRPLCLSHMQSQSESEHLIAAGGRGVRASGKVNPRRSRTAPSPRCPHRAEAAAAGSATGPLLPRGQGARSPRRCRESLQR